MKKLSIVATLALLTLFGASCTTMTAQKLDQATNAQGTMNRAPTVDGTSGAKGSTAFPIGSATTTPAEWKKILTPDQYGIIWQQGTEVPFSSPLDYETRPGTYVSADCGIPLFRSEQKYDSGTGWPSFWAPIDPSVVKLVQDNSIPFESRTEVEDAKCGGHLGHVFDDGPPPTRKRYCMNGLALRFIPDATSTTSTKKTTR